MPYVTAYILIVLTVVMVAVLPRLLGNKRRPRGDHAAPPAAGPATIHDISDLARTDRVLEKVS